ncbi:MAG: energy-coupling factor transporter transmembrane component T [Actinomycetota bacterium]
MYPVAWIAWASGAAFVAFSTANPWYLLPLVGVAWFVHAAHQRDGPWARSFRMFLTFAVIAIVLRTGLVLFGTVNASNVVYAAYEGLRLGVLLVVFGTFNSVTDPFGVLRLAPRRFHEPALAAALALSIAPRTIAAAGRVREAQELRGFRLRKWRSLPALAVPVLETGMEEAMTLAESMDARGHGRGRRSRYRPERWSPGAVVTAASGLIAGSVFVSQAIAHRPDLIPITDPLTWPEATPWLVGVVLLLAVPGLLPRRDERR